MDEHFHALWWSSLTVSQVFSSKPSGPIIAKQINVMLCINCYIMWKKINMNNAFWIPKHTCHDLASWWLCPKFLEWWSFLTRFHDGMKQYIHISLQAAIHSKNVSLQFKPVQMSSRQSICCIFWSNVNISGTQQAHTISNNKGYMDRCFSTSNIIQYYTLQYRGSQNSLFDTVNVHIAYSC
jgi:hypothetical protein